MENDVKRTPIIQVPIQEFYVLEKLDKLAEIYGVDRNVLVNLALKQFVSNTVE
jgi:hypothetical protein